MGVGRICAREADLAEAFHAIDRLLNNEGPAGESQAPAACGSARSGVRLWDALLAYAHQAPRRRPLFLW
jgi:hypothetical protein